MELSIFQIIPRPRINRPKAPARSLAERVEATLRDTSMSQKMRVETAIAMCRLSTASERANEDGHIRA